MLRQLIKIFRSGEPLEAMGSDFAKMFQITYKTTLKAGEVYFGEEVAPDDRTWIYKQDVKVNKLERKIRKRVIVHLATADNSLHLPYCLLLMSLVKDVERLGDYAKNLSEVVDYHTEPLPADELVAELREIRSCVETAFGSTAEVFERSDVARAAELIHEGQDMTRRCDQLCENIAASDHGAGVTTALILGARFYKRIAKHVLNVLSSVVMPLHKLDYYDEDAIPPELRTHA